jgi:hypothetical protein
VDRALLAELNSLLHKMGKPSDMEQYVLDLEDEFDSDLKRDWEAAKKIEEKDKATTLFLFLLLALLAHFHARAILAGILESQNFLKLTQLPSNTSELITEITGKYQAWATDFVQDIRNTSFESQEYRLDRWSRVWGSYNEAKARSMPPTVLIDWILDDTAQHCTQCPSLSQGGPYTTLTLPTYPGQTLCGSNCKCSLVYRQKERRNVSV